jgi:hypothetical protein
MAKTKLEVEVSKEAYELGAAVVSLVAGVKNLMADGKVEVAEIVALAMAEMTSLVEAVKGIDQLDEEAKEDVAAFSKAFAIPLADVPGMFITPKLPEVPQV